MSEEQTNDEVKATETPAPAPEAEPTVQTEPTPIEGGVEDKNVAAENTVTPEDQPELPEPTKQENELIRQSVQALTDFSNFR